MTSEPDPVELTTARSAFEAEWLIGGLANEGLSAFVLGEGLADEFTLSQAAMGLSGGIRVMVAREDLEAARAALARLLPDRPVDAEEETEVERDDAGGRPDAPAASPGKTLAIVLLAAGVIALGWLALEQRDTISAWERASAVTEAVWKGDILDVRWRDNGKRAFHYRDGDHNGVFEEIWTYNREGKPTTRLLDRNQNEIPELMQFLDAEGREALRALDENENGIYERFEYPPRDGVLEIWIDADEDRRYERYEFVDAESGEVLDAFEDRGRKGFVRVK